MQQLVPPSAQPASSFISKVLRYGGMALVVAVMLAGLLGPLLAWPRMDESTYMLEARSMAMGLLPYRDFFQFVTPGCQLIGALYIRLVGFSMIGMRLLVLVGWLIQLVLLVQMGQKHLPKTWLWAFAGFLWLTSTRYVVFYHHFWSGFMALGAVYGVWCYLQQVYGEQRGRWALVGSGVLTALCFWTTQSLGTAITGILLLFSLLHLFLHQREQNALNRQPVNWIALFTRWFQQWGLYWALPMLLVHVGFVGWLMASGIWQAFLQDTVVWLGTGHYLKTTMVGYFSTFPGELQETLKPLLDRVPMPLAMLFWFRVPVAMHLFLIGLLPALGVFGVGYWLPARFLYRMLQLMDEELLLFWFASVAMVVATFSYSISMHIVCNCGLAFLLGWIAIYQWVQWRPAFLRLCKITVPVFYGLLLVAALIGSGMMIAFSTPLPVFRGTSEPLLWTYSKEEAQEFVQNARWMDWADAHQQSVVVLYQKPSLYLASPVQEAIRYHFAWPVYMSDKQVSEMIQDIGKNKPIFIVEDRTLETLHLDPRVQNIPREKLRFPALETVLRQDYQPMAVMRYYTVHQLKPAR